MKSVHKAQATAAALSFSFLSVFALGIATGAPEHGKWLAEIEAIHAVHAIEAPEASEAPKAVPACEAAPKAAAVEEIEI